MRLIIGIYCIKNKINNKCYVGQSLNIKKRWIAHKSRAFNKNSSDYESKLYRSIRKYGLENFDFFVLEECEKEELNDKEKYWINQLNTFNNGYNLTLGGQNCATYCKLNATQVEEIIKLLLKSNLNEQQIANIFNVSQRTISGINLGEIWYKKNLSYPLINNRIKEKKKFFCIDCGKKITKYGKRCISCARKLQRKTERPSREKLKDLIRTKSLLYIANLYNVTDNAIRKWCKRYNLPYTKKEINSYSDEEWNLI